MTAVFLCPLCLHNPVEANRKTVYFKTEKERLFHFLDHEPYVLAWAYNDLLTILERKHMMNNREVLK